jgi:hypothetical protein
MLTITNWSCISPLIIIGAPDISITGNFSLLNGAPLSQQEIVIGGAFDWGSSSNETCNINLTAIFDPNGKGTLSGIVCGMAVNTGF